MTFAGKKKLVMGVKFLQLLVLFLKADCSIKISSVGELPQTFIPREVQSRNLMQKQECLASAYAYLQKEWNTTIKRDSGT